MTRSTIDYGIDLGTTNSAVAVLKGTQTEIVKNNEEMDCTPSAVMIDKAGSFIVGRYAKERVVNDHQNAFCEFKLQMGTSNEYEFRRSGRTMRAEELSAEVLKSLRNDVKQRAAEELQAAVITVPAAFELPQCDATKRAAELAGFRLSPLLQEPVAAALAYGFQSESNNVFWLVYDFGGGTFDAAVIQVRDGVIQVVNHGGDNHLGGKLIDWAIVEELLIPAVNREFRIAGFDRSNPRYIGAVAKLKNEAEKAKIRLSRFESAEILIDPLCMDDSGDSVTFEFDLRKADVERLMEPFALRSINICKRVLDQKRLGPSNVEKIILVGGPTLTPYLRDRLTDPVEGLGIPLDFSIDPMTVVARGAAVFAGTQRLEVGTPRVATAGQYAIELEYSPVGSDQEPLVGGKVVASDGGALNGFTIEFVNAEAKTPWRSGRVPVAPTGAFMANLWAEKGAPNVYAIELYDTFGTRVETVPDKLTYTVGMSISDQPLIHSLGIALANNDVQTFFEKGKALPAKRRNVHRTAIEVRRGQDKDLLRIPVIEGENRRADRNRLIGTLKIAAADIRRDVPAGSEVEITINVDQSRIVTTKAYVPLLDEEFEQVIKLEGSMTVDRSDLEDGIAREKKRLDDMRRKAHEIDDPKAKSLLDRIEAERIEQDIETSFSASRVDRDAADKCQKRLLDLKLALDEIEDALEWPTLAGEAEDELGRVRALVENHGSFSDKQRFASLERETQRAVSSRDADLLRRKRDDLSSLKFRILRELPEWWVGLLQDLEDYRPQMRDQVQADRLFAQGYRAINDNDVQSLKSAVNQLISLLPVDRQTDIGGKGFGSTVL